MSILLMVWVSYHSFLHLFCMLFSYIMNRILYVARKAKGFTELQVAKALQIEENAYIEMEHSLAYVSADIALRFAKIFDIDPELFIYLY